MSEELKPCPFCGRPAKLDVDEVRDDNAWCFVRCSYRCKAAPYVGEHACIWYWSEGKKHRHQSDDKAREQAKERAITAWNTRVSPDYDALSAQRDEGLAREAELQSEVQRLAFERQPLEGAYSAVLKQNDALQQRLAEAEKLLTACEGAPLSWGHSASGITKFLASHGCADAQKAPAPALNLPRRKVKTEYSTAEEDAQVDSWNAALDAVQELNR